MIKETVPDIIEKLIKTFETKGLVRAVIKTEQASYTFADGQLDIQRAAAVKKKAEEPAPKSEKTKFETRDQANEFFEDYIKVRKSPPARKRPWLAIAAVILAVAIVFWAILWLPGRIGKNASPPTPSADQGQQASAAEAARSQASLADANYSALFEEATSLLAANQFAAAWQKAELAEKVKPTAELLSLKKEIQIKQQEADAEAKLQDEKRKKEESAAKDSAVKNYLEASRRSLKEGDYTRAFEYVYKARQVRPGPDVDEQELQIKTIQALIAEQKNLIQKRNAEIAAKEKADEEKRIREENASKEKSRDSYLVLCNSFLKKGNPEKASYWLLQAKNIRNSPDLFELEKQIKSLIDSKPNEDQSTPQPLPAQGNTPAQAGPASAMVQPTIKPGRVSDLTFELAENFSALVKRLEITDVVSDFSPNGSVTVTLRIDEKGGAQVQDINDNGLSVESESYRQLIRKSIAGKFNGLRFPEPKNKAGERIRIETWRLNFKVGKFSGKIIMNRQ